MGLLDQLPDINTPEGQGLMSAAFSLLQARKGNGRGFASALGDAGQQFMQTRNQSQDMAQRRSMNDLQMQGQRLQLDQAQRAGMREQEMAALRQRFQRPEGFDYQGYAQALAASDPMGAFDLLQKLNPAPKRETVAPGSTVLSFGKDGTPTPVFTAPDKPKEIAPTELAKLIAERNKFPPGDPNRAMYDSAIRKATTHQPGTNVNIDTRFENEFSKKSGGNFAEMYGDINKQGFRAPAQLRNLERIEQLLEGVDGGKLAPTGMELASIANSFGIKIDPKLGNKQAAESLSREMALGLREPGTGPMTDKDFANFMEIVPNLSKTAEGRKTIVATMRNKLARDVKISSMAREYVKKNGTMNEGFLDEVGDFMARNPVVSMPRGYRVERLP